MANELLDTLNKAPEIVKIRAAATNAAFRRMLAAEKQLSAWTEECDAAKQSYEAESKEFNVVLQRWNPETNELEHLAER